MFNHEEFLDYFKTTDIFKRMENCTHHFENEDGTFDVCPYHVEGDIAEHTLMVYEQALLLPDSEMKDILIAVSLLHDTGKLYTRYQNNEKHKVSFYGHEGVSTFIAVSFKDKLLECGLTEEQFIYVLYIINWHMVKFKKDVTILSPFKELVDTFNILDSNGAMNEKELLPIPQKIIEIEKIYKDKMSDPYCIFNIGIPGSGKSTSVEQEENILSRDNILTELYPDVSYSEAWEKADHDLINKTFEERKRKFIKEEMSFVVDRTNMSERSRRQIYSNLPYYYSVRYRIFMRGFEETLKYNSEEREGKIIDKDVIIKMGSSFYLPNNIYLTDFYFFKENK